jgi:ferredoxin
MPDETSEGAKRSIGGGAGLRVSVDHELCSGMGYCARAEPAVFELRADDKSWVRDDVDWSTIDHGRLHNAAAACPWMAIEVTTD